MFQRLRACYIFGVPRCSVFYIQCARCEASEIWVLRFGSREFELPRFRVSEIPEFPPPLRSEMLCSRHSGRTRCRTSEIWSFRWLGSSRLSVSETQDFQDVERQGVWALMFGTSEIFWGIRDTHMHTRRHGEMLAVIDQFCSSPHAGSAPSRLSAVSFPRRSARVHVRLK